MYQIYVISFNILWELLYPPILRKPKALSWGYVLVKPLQKLRDLIFDNYAGGSVYNLYDNTTTYTTGDRVIDTDRRVYECLFTTTGNLPTDTTYWELIADNYIGVRERIKYNSQKLLFEFALNRWFICSGIYINNTPITLTGFLMGGTGPFSSTLSNSSLPNANPSYLMNVYSVPGSASFTIYVPILVFNALGTNNIDRENIIRSFADNYCLAGMKYDVVSY